LIVLGACIDACTLYFVRGSGFFSELKFTSRALHNKDEATIETVPSTKHKYKKANTKQMI